MDLSSLPDFRGKVVCLFSGFDLYAKVIHEPRWEEQGGRLFLCGDIPHDAPRIGDYHGGQLCFAWDVDWQDRLGLGAT